MNVRREGMGNPDPRKTPIHLPGNRRAEQDWQDAWSERPAMGYGTPEAGLGELATVHGRLEACPTPETGWKPAPPETVWKPAPQETG